MNTGRSAVTSTLNFNKEFDEWGESVYYLEVPKYNKLQ